MGAFMIWTWIRYALILASGVCLIALLYELGQEGQEGRLSDVPWYVFAILAALFLNIAYLLFAPSQPTRSGRLTRLVALWLDAKEAELRKRAGKSETFK
jgi:hypothetical protein